MPITLEVRTGPARGQKAMARESQSLRVGSAKDMDLALVSDPLVSSEHFVLRWEGQTWGLIDSNSRLGTFLNGQRVTRSEIHDGDKIVAGQTHIAVRLNKEPTGPVPAKQAELSSTSANWKPLFRPDLVGQVASLVRAQSGPVYALLDAARDPHVLGLLIVEDIPYRSLYEGLKAEEFADFAPYLVELPTEAPLLDVLLREGWNRSWGVFVTSPQPFAEVRRHFRHFLLAKLPDGEDVLFRFYDPRVLRVFLPTCNIEETEAFFGPVTSFLVEGQVPGTVLRFTATDKGVNQEVISFGPCVDVASDLPWVKAVLDNCTDLPEEERLNLLLGWKEALPVPGKVVDYR